MRGAAQLALRRSDTGTAESGPPAHPRPERHGTAQHCGARQHGGDTETAFVRRGERPAAGERGGLCCHWEPRNQASGLPALAAALASKHTGCEGRAAEAGHTGGLRCEAMRDECHIAPVGTGTDCATAGGLGRRLPARDLPADQGRGHTGGAAARGHGRGPAVAGCRGSHSPLGGAPRGGGSHQPATYRQTDGADAGPVGCQEAEAGARRVEPHLPALGERRCHIHERGGEGRLGAGDGAGKSKRTRQPDGLGPAGC